MLGHMGVVAIIITACLCALVCFDYISAPEKEAVQNEGADLVLCERTREYVSSRQENGHSQPHLPFA